MTHPAKSAVKYSDLSASRRWFLLILVSVGSSIIYTPAYLKNVFYQPLIEGLGITNADLGALLGAYSITAMICYLPAGMLADKIRVRTLSWTGMAGTAALTFCYAMIPSLQMLYVVFIGMGITSILIWWGTRFKLVRLLFSAQEYPGKIGISYSIYGLAGLVLGLINTMIVSLIADTAQSITVLLLFLSVLIFIFAILSFLFIPEFAGEIDASTSNFDLQGTLSAFKNAGVIWAAVAMFFIYALYQGITYTTPFMSAEFAAPVAVVSIIGLIRTYGIGLIAGPAAGKLAEIIKSPAQAIIIFLVMSIIMLVAFLLLPRNHSLMVVVAILVVIVGFITYGCFSIGSSTLTEAKVPLPIFGAASGILSIVGFLPDTFLHTWFGRMIDQQGQNAYNTIFMILIIFAIAGVLSCWMVRRCGLKSARDALNVPADENS